MIFQSFITIEYSQGLVTWTSRQKSALVALVAARDLRDDFKPDKNYVDSVCKEKGPGTYTYSPTGSNTVLFIFYGRISFFDAFSRKTKLLIGFFGWTCHVSKRRPGI